MAHIDKCIRDLLHKSGKKAAHDHAAPWVPDTEASICMVCNKSQFTLINRRVSELRYYLLSNLIIDFIFLIDINSHKNKHIQGASAVLTPLTSKIFTPQK